MPNSLSELHTLHAWEDNQITERCTQGEYAGKVLQFKLVDKDGAINLSNCLVQYAVTRPDKTEDLLECTVDNGVVKCNLTYSVTSVVGLVHGEVRVIGSNDSGIIKFYGVNLRVYKGVSDEAVEQSDEFSALIAALQKVVSITPDPDSENTYVVRLDDSIVQNGLNPVASGVIYNALQGKYNYIYSNSTSSTYIDSCTQNDTIYRAYVVSGIVANSFMDVICVDSSNKKIQYGFTRAGIIIFRGKHTNDSEWTDWDYIPIHSQTFTMINDMFISRYKSISADISYNSHNSEVADYLSKPAYSSNDYSNTNIPENLSNNHYDRPLYGEIPVPSGGSKIIILDTETQKEWLDSVSGSTYSIYNLIPERLYTYTILNSSNKELSSGTCIAHNSLRMINGGGDTFNIRDLGGWKCKEDSTTVGKIKYGLIYRGGELNKTVTLSSSQVSLFKDFLGVRDEIDLRGDSSASGITDTALGAGVDYIRIPLLYYQLSLPEGQKYATLIKRLAKNIKENKITYIHCQAGADRTAELCLMIEAICGVSQSDIDRDYELTSFSFMNNGQRNLRVRNSSTDADWQQLISGIVAMEGNNFSDKVVRYLLRNGVTIEEINDIRFGLIDGAPSKLSNPYGTVTIAKDLSHVFIDNESTSVKLYQPFEANLTVEDWYKLNYGSTTTYEITMGGTDITSNCANGKIRIERVTGNITIKAIAVDNEARIDSRIDDLDSRFELQTTVGFDENGIPVFVSHNPSFSAGACQVENIKTLFIASNVVNISAGAFVTHSHDITTVYVDKAQVDISIHSGAFPNDATIYYKGEFNALGFVIVALQHLITTMNTELATKLDDANNSVKTNHITDGNVTEVKLSSEVQAKINKNTGVYTYTISASNWNNKAQILNLSSVYTVTNKTKVDIEADDTVLEQLSIDDCEGIYVENNNGTLTVKAIANSPAENITVQLVVYEVETLS